MGKIRTQFKTPLGEVEVEAADFKELLEYVKQLDDYLRSATQLLKAGEILRQAPSNELSGLIENTSDGPVLTVPKGKITTKEAVLMLLRGFDKPVGAQELSKALTLSGHMSAGFPTRLSELRHEGHLMKDEGGIYRLTTSGSRFVENKLIPKLRTIVEE